MSRLLPTLVALLLMFGAGFGATMIVLRKAPRIPVAQLLSISWLLGSAVISLSLWLLGLLIHGTPLQVLVTVMAIGLTLVGIRLARKTTIELPQSLGWIDYGLGALLGVASALILVLTFKHTLGWDGLLIWELKARYAYLNGGALPTAYFSDASRVFSHPEYPLYLPMIEMWIYQWIGEPDQYWVKLIFPVYYAFGTIFLAQAAGTLSGNRRIGLLAANLFLLIPFLTRAAGGIVLGYADVPLSIMYCAAFYFLWNFARTNSNDALSLFLIFSALLPWVKKEGAILWFALMLSGLPFILRRRGSVVAVLSLGSGSMIAIWQFYLHSMQAGPAQDFVPISVSHAVSHLSRLGPILQVLVEEATTLSRWNLLWFMTIFAFCSFAILNRTRRALILVVCSVLPIALYCATYLFSSWPDYLDHVRSSLPRLLLHVAPLAILSIALALTRPPRET